MNILEKNISNTICLSLSCWFALCVFLTSDELCERENEIKWYMAKSGGCVLLIVYALFCNKVRCTITHYSILILLRSLFLVGSFLAIHGILQFFLFLPSNHSMFRVTGSFENPAGISAVLAMLLPIGLHWSVSKINRASLISSILVILVLATIILSGARAAMLAAFLSIITVLVMHTSIRKWLRQHKNYLCVFVVLLIGLVIGLYCWKSDSVLGRLYVWRIALSLSFEDLVTGLGVDGFRAHYMLQQADYFNHFPYSYYAELADNISHPFNEFIYILVNYGFLGLIAFVGFMFFVIIQTFKKKQRYSSVVISTILTLFVLCLFSYPLRYAPVWIVFILVSILTFQQYLPQSVHYMFRLAILTFSIYSLCILSKDMIANKNWKRISDRALAGYSEQMLPYFQYLHDNTCLRENPYFLYNYAAELNYSGKYSESVGIIKECQEYLNDYDVVILLADNYSELNMPDSTLKFARLASLMIPCRFLPLNYMLNAYIEKDYDELAKKVAKEILSKPVKVNSAFVDDIRNDAKIILNQ